MFRLWDILMDEAGDLGGGGGGGDVALADTGADLDLGGDDSGDGGESTEETGLAVIEPEIVDSAETQEVARYAPIESNGRWSARANKDLGALRKTSPLLFQQIMRDRADVTRLRSMAPADKKPFEYAGYLQKTIKDLGGEEGIQALLGKSATFDELDELFTKADPAVLDKYLMGDPQGVSAIMRLLPHIVARVEKLEGGPAALLGMLGTLQNLQSRVAPNASKKAVAKTVKNTLNNFYFEYHLNMMASLLPPDNEVANKSYQSLKGLLGAVDEALTLAPETLPDAPAPKAPEKNDELDQQRQQLAQRETNFRREQWRSTSDASKNRVITKAWTELSKGRKIDTIVREDVASAMALRLQQVAKQTGLGNSLEGFFQKNDSIGYERFLANFYDTNIPRIMKVELEKRTRRGSAAPAVIPPAKPGQPAVRQQPAQGFVKVAAMPHSNEISHQTSTDMIMKKQAILKDGRKVFWA